VSSGVVEQVIDVRLHLRIKPALHQVAGTALTMSRTSSGPVRGRHRPWRHTMLTPLWLALGTTIGAKPSTSSGCNELDRPKLRRAGLAAFGSTTSSK